MTYFQFVDTTCPYSTNTEIKSYKSNYWLHDWESSQWHSLWQRYPRPVDNRTLKIQESSREVSFICGQKLVRRMDHKQFQGKKALVTGAGKGFIVLYHSIFAKCIIILSNLIWCALINLCYLSVSSLSIYKPRPLYQLNKTFTFLYCKIQ